MNKIVVKFGGSNFKTAEDIETLCRVVKLYNRPLVIVVSAFYGITNQLIENLNKAKKDLSSIDAFTAKLTELKSGILNIYVKDEELRRLTMKEVNARLNKLENYFKGSNYIGYIPDFVEDAVLSYGERLSSLIFSTILKSKGIDCVEIMPEEINLLTDGVFGKATVNFEKATKFVHNKLADNKIYVMPGFYGISDDGRVTLFGRGGSDYSAAAIAGCISANSLDLWKDVDGFMSANPKLVDNSVVIKKMTYAEAAELAYFGAKIMHQRTVEPLLNKNIPIRIFNIFNTNNSLTPMTVINSEETLKEDVIKSVTYSDDFGIIKLKGPEIGATQGIMAKIGSKLDAAGINIKCIINSLTDINLLLAEKDMSKAFEIIKNLNLNGIYEMLRITDISTIAVVGNGMTSIPGIAARIFSTIAKKNINVIVIFFGASDVSSYFILKRNDRDEAVKLIHEEFFT